MKTKASFERPAAVTPDIVINDMQRKGLVHEIRVETIPGGTGHRPVPSGGSPAPPMSIVLSAAGDNLRLIRDLMKNVEKEAGSADFAALEAEIKALDREIDECVYELYGLTPEEIKIVEQAR